MKIIFQKLMSLDRKYIARHSVWLYFVKMTTTFIILAVAYLFANYMDPETYGTYKYILSFIGILSAFTLSGLSDVIARDMAKNQHNILLDAFKITYRWHFVFILLSLSITGYYIHNDNNQLGFSFLAIAILYPLIQASGITKKYLAGRSEFKYNSLQELVSTTIRSFSIIGAILLTNNPFYIIFSYLLSETIIRSIFYIQLRYRDRRLPNSKLEKQSLNYARKITGLKIFNKIGLYFDQVVIFQLLGPAQLAVYTIALAIPKELESLNKPIQSMILPRVSNLSISSIKKIIDYRAILYIIPFLGIILVYYFSSAWLFGLLFPKYSEAIPLTQIAILILLCSPHNLYRQTLFAHGKSRELLILDSFIAIARIILSTLLIWFYGLMGAIIALVITRILRICTTIFLTKRITD